MDSNRISDARTWLNKAQNRWRKDDFLFRLNLMNSICARTRADCVRMARQCDNRNVTAFWCARGFVRTSAFMHFKSVRIGTALARQLQIDIQCIASVIRHSNGNDICPPNNLTKLLITIAFCVASTRSVSSDISQFAIRTHKNHVNGWISDSIFERTRRNILIEFDFELVSARNDHASDRPRLWCSWSRWPIRFGCDRHTTLARRLFVADAHSSCSSIRNISSVYASFETRLDRNHSRSWWVVNKTFLFLSKRPFDGDDTIPIESNLKYSQSLISGQFFTFSKHFSAIYWI